MEPDRWKQVETIVAAALELETAERGSYVSGACAGDHELRAEVDEILAGENAAVDFLGDVKDLIRVDKAGHDPMMTDPLIGTKIGHYSIEEPIGRGGMGAVYLVRRADAEYEKHAALKLLHPGMASHSLLQRFRTERQILAVLEHPNIARLLDGGTTADGLPYLVMEYIDGVPLDRYCDEHVLDCRERVELFLQVCDAVAFAHRGLVVHRDLKPGNILVTEDGAPKLLDFGIAKLLDAEAIPGGDDLTRTGLRPMSPGYASPEQIRGRPITTASDVYSLGVVLYRLLTGRLPRDFDDLTPVAMERGLNREPTAPSTTIGEEGRGALVSARNLRGDLDAILLKSLREEPEQRYASVDDLADDLRRHLGGLPVGARHGTLGYRAGRFLRRHAAAVSVSVMVGAMAVGSVVALLQQNRRVSYQRDRAEAMAEFSSGLLAVDQVLWNIDNETPVAYRLWKNLEDTKSRLSTEPVLRSDQLILLARGLFTLGRAPEGEKYAKEALELRRASTYSTGLEDRPLLNDLASILSTIGRYDDAVSMLESTPNSVASNTSTSVMEIARSHTLLGMCKWNQLKLTEAENHIKTALEITREYLGDDHVRTVELLTALGILEVTRTPESAEAVAFLQEAVQRFDTCGSTSLFQWPAIRVLAGTLSSNGEYGRAIDAYLKGQKIDQEVRGWTFAERVLELGVLFLTRGQFSAADPYLSVGLYASADQRWRFDILEASARLQLDLGELAEAEMDCELISLLVLRPERSGISPGIDYRCMSLQHQALIDLRRGEFESAKAITLRSLRMIQAADQDRMWTLESKVVGAEVLFALGEFENALGLLLEATSYWQSHGDRWRPKYVRSLQLLAEISAHTGPEEQTKGLMERLRKVVEQQRAIDPSPRINEQLAEVHRIRGDFFHQAGDLESAHAEWREALRLLTLNPEGTIGADHHLIAGKTRIRLGEAAEARPHARYLFERGWRWPEWVATMGK